VNVYNSLYSKLTTLAYMSQNPRDQGSMQQAGSQWAEIVSQLFDKLTGKGASVSYNFDNLVIDIPRAQGPDGRDLGNAKWTINGRVVITAEAHESSEGESKRASSVSSMT
jgi:hypothetical protein